MNDQSVLKSHVVEDEWRIVASLRNALTLNYDAICPCIDIKLYTSKWKTDLEIRSIWAPDLWIWHPNWFKGLLLRGRQKSFSKANLLRNFVLYPTTDFDFVSLRDQIDPSLQHLQSHLNQWPTSNCFILWSPMAKRRRLRLQRRANLSSMPKDNINC